jgi:hypothetical protein
LSNSGKDSTCQTSYNEALLQHAKPSFSVRKLNISVSVVLDVIIPLNGKVLLSAVVVAGSTCFCYCVIIRGTSGVDCILHQKLAVKSLPPTSFLFSHRLPAAFH